LAPDEDDPEIGEDGENVERLKADAVADQREGDKRRWLDGAERDQDTDVEERHGGVGEPLEPDIAEAVDPPDEFDGDDHGGELADGVRA